MTNKNEKLCEFEGFRLDAEKKVLWRGGEIVQLPPKAVEILIVLAKNSGEVVTKNQLLEEVWGATFVEEANLTNNVYLLRKVFGEFSPAAKNLIQTVPRRGYRFGGKNLESDGEFVLEHHVFEQVLIEETFGDVETELQTSERAAKKQLLPKPVSSLRRIAAPLAAVVLFLALASVFAVWQLTRTTARNDLASVKSIAVLPLKSFAANQADEELRMRITDALITEIGAAKNLSVRPTSAVLPFVGKESNALEIGKKLEVDAVLDGRVQQENDRVRVTLQLVSVTTGEQLWSKQFDGKTNEILNLQDAIDRSFAQKFDSGGETAGKRPTENAEAYEYYLKGRYFWQKRGEEDLHKAINYFEKAVELDKNFADALVGLADSQYALFDYSFDTAPENVRRAKENLLRAIELDPNSAEALTTLGLIQTTFEWNWRQAEDSLKKAIEIAPNSPNAHHRYGTLLVKLRRFDEAETELRRARELDPTSPAVNANLGVELYFSKQYERAIEQFGKTLELDAKFLAARWRLSRCLWMKGEKETALAEYVKTFHIIGDEESASLVEQNLNRETPDAIVLKLSRNWEKRIDDNSINASDLAILAAHRRDAEETLYWADRTTNARHPWATWMNAEPEFDFVRDDARFQTILRGMNFQN